jgi:hypothetical protein
MTLERSRGDRYALSALKNKRATLAGEVVQLERQLRHRRESLVHVDACLRLLDPATVPGWPAPRLDTKDYVRLRPLLASVWAGRSAA